MIDRIEIHERHGMWIGLVNGDIAGCARTRDAVVDILGALLRNELDDGTHDGIEAVGLTIDELAPKRSSPSTVPLPSLIDFAEAKLRVADQWLPISERRVKTQVEIVDDLCVAYEWGWEIHWRPINPDDGDPRFVNEYHFPYLADRVTGTVWLSGGTRGIRRGIIELLQKRPDELRGPYPPGKQGWLTVVDEFEKAGAFEPQNK
ncbi:Rossmann-fold NAD(P)-binding domain-containing protein [Lignipirellula cremea]|nr:hypothetical protein [Lignipirellula cremea]